VVLADGGRDVRVRPELSGATTADPGQRINAAAHPAAPDARTSLLSQYRTIMWRYVNAVILEIAQRLLRNIDAGHLRVAAYQPGQVASRDTGFDHLGRDLRVRLSPITPAEQIWLVGLSTHIRVPFPNYFRGSVVEAASVARQLSAT
jgi:hypothetical protein